MFSNFKNFERLRYQLIDDYTSIQKQKRPEEQFIESSLFSGLLSMIVSDLLSNEMSLWLVNCNHKFIIRLSVLIVVYIGLFISFKYIYVKIEDKIYFRKIHCSKGIQTEERLIKKFDNIAIDSLIMAMGYRDCLEDLSSGISANTHELFLYEMIHYIDTAQKITNQLFQLKDSCINQGDLSDRIDRYRVCNAVNIMDELMTNVDNHVFDYKLNDNVLLENIHRIKQGIKDLKEFSDNLQN